MLPFICKGIQGMDQLIIITSVKRLNRRLFKRIILHSIPILSFFFLYRNLKLQDSTDRPSDLYSQQRDLDWHVVQSEACSVMETAPIQ